MPFMVRKKSIERSVCPSSADEHGKVRGKTSYAQVKDFQCPFIPNFSSTLNLGSSVEQEEIEFGGGLTELHSKSSSCALREVIKVLESFNLHLNRVPDPFLSGL